MALTDVARLTGTIERKHDHTCTILCDQDSRRYFAYRANFDTFDLPWHLVRVTMRVSFLGVESDRRRDDPRAIEIRIIAGPMDSEVG